MYIDRDAWYTKMAYCGEGIPPRVSLCGFFWRVVFPPLWCVVLAFAFANLVVLVGAGSLILALALILLVTGNIRGRRWSRIFGGSLLAGFVVAWLIVGWLELGWSLFIPAVLGSVLGVSAGMVLIQGAVYISDKIAKRQPILTARTKALKERICPIVEIRYKDHHNIGDSGA